MTVAVAVLVLSAALVAVTVTVCEVTEVGAVYKPAVESEPTLGFTVQVTPVLLVPVTMAEICFVCAAVNVTLAGVTEIATEGFTIIVALAFLVASAALVAVTLTDCVLVMPDGAVYRPAQEMMPVAGLSVQVTAVLLLPATAVVNCSV